MLKPANREYKKNQMLTQFEESLLTQGQASGIIESFLKYMKHDNKLVLDNLKKIETQRDEAEKEVSQKIKTSLQGV